MRLADIGEALDIPVGTVKSRLHYATASLRAAIEADAGRRRPHEGATRMTDRTFDRIADDFLSPGPTVLPDRVLDAAFEEVHGTRRRRVLGARRGGSRP